MGDVYGYVFNIERYTLHDGPGIRTTVFLKGCRLRCVWCSNPESQSSEPELAQFPENCLGCGRCVEVCRQGALELDPETSVVRLDRFRCTVCGDCARICPAEALVFMGELISAREVMEEVSRDKLFYIESGGGVTLSGGDVLTQPDFGAEILRLARLEGISSAIQTCGYGRRQDVEKLAPLVDLVIFDLKLLDSEKHKSLTGLDNRLILENLDCIDRLGVPIVIQIPLIPGLNDSDTELKQIFEWASGLKSLVGFSLLAYHNLGQGKYARLGRMYQLSNLTSPPQSYLEAKIDWAMDQGVNVIRFGE